MKNVKPFTLHDFSCSLTNNNSINRKQSIIMRITPFSHSSLFLCMHHRQSKYQVSMEIGNMIFQLSKQSQYTIDNIKTIPAILRVDAQCET